MLRTRFAPSPTGSLHVGGARTALYCWLLARAAGEDGRFLLRIEDTDQARSTEEAAAGILRDMAWLGLDWDEGPGRDEAGTGPYYQSQRLGRYGEVFHVLLELGRVYEAWESTDELKQARDAAMADKRNFRYRRHSYTNEQLTAFQEEGRTPVLRVTAPGHDLTIRDTILGEVEVADVDQEDFVVRKADGFPTYHFAVVCDDHDMGVTLVLRGQEHLLNTAKHLTLYQALGWEPPRHAHLPLIFNLAGGKMSKRDKAKAARAAARDAAKAHAAEHGHGPKDYTWLAEGTGFELEDVDAFMAKKHDGVALAEALAELLDLELPMIEVMDFRKGGYLPEGLLNYLALLGWSAGDDKELYTLVDLVEAFSLNRIGKTAAKFDPAKLTAINAQHMRAASIGRLMSAHDSYLEVVPDSPLAGLSTERRQAFLSMYQQRMETFRHLDDQVGFFFEAPTRWDDKAVKRHLLKGDGLARLEAMRDVLASVSPWTPQAIHGAIEAWAIANKYNVGKAAQPVRVAVTGTGVSPGIDETLALIDQVDVLSRIDDCLAAVGRGG